MNRILASVLIVASLIFATLGNATYAQTTAKGAKVASSPASPLKLSLPVTEGSVRFAVIGDTGSGSDKQRQVADTMVRWRNAFPFDFVLMMGDNLYGGESARDFQTKFSDVYKQLLDSNVKFYATLGNHDLPIQVNYQYFNMNGKEYYRFKKGNIAFYSLNSNYMDKKQVQWLQDELAKDTSDWKIAFFHHPPYSSAAAHGSDKQLREVVEPIFIKYGMNVVLSGHDHVYERIKPQKGIYYFVSGAGGRLRSGDVKDSSLLTEKSFDRDMHFMLFEAVGNNLHFQVISRTGETVDSGVIVKQKSK
jgi:predicted MPP superfamily phosphohydrolase